MRYLDPQMDDYRLEQMFQRRMDEMREGFERRLEILERPERTPINYIASPNYLLNSHPEWSKAAWENTGIDASTVTDDNRTCYNWFYQQQSQTTLSSSTTVTSTQGPLIASGHSAFTTPNADAPIWDRENARFLVGHETNAYDISCPLARDFVFPGQRFFVYFETIAVEPTLDLEGAQFYCGFWDNTSGQRKWIEGANFTPTASIYGAGGTRTLTYEILAATDGGDEIISNTITVNNAPNTLSPTNHVRLSFAGAPGFISFKVYRYDGLVYRLVGDIRNSIDLQFFDMQEGAGSLAMGFPSTTDQRPLAKATTTSLVAVENSYTAHTMIIQVPTTYNRANTGNNQQWFRFGLTGPISHARKLGIRRIMVSEGYGPWVRNQGDLTVSRSSPSGTATSAPVPGTTVGGGPDNGPYCVTLDTLVEVLRIEGGADVVESIPISEVTRGMRLVCGLDALPVEQVKDGVVQETYTIRTKRGFVLTCSASHRLVKSRTDRQGTAAKHLKVGDRLLTSEEGTLAQDVIEHIIVTPGPVDVRTVSLPNPHLFVTNGLVSHNSKIDPELEKIAY